MTLLGNENWKSRYDLLFSLWFERAECEFQSGSFDTAETLILELLDRATSITDRAAVYRLKIDLHVMKGEHSKAVDSALECLRLLGINMTAHPTLEQVKPEHEKVWHNLGDRSV